MNAPPLTLSQTQVCEYTGYSVATVRMLERKGYLLKLLFEGWDDSATFSIAIFSFWDRHDS